MCTPARSSAARRSLSLTRARAPHSPYDLLGLFENATDADVKDAYRDLARLFHPDRNHGKDQSAERTEHFVRIKKAYECLIDPDKRRMYDVCAVNRERLVRRNIWKFAVNHIPDYRDTVDIQVREKCAPLLNTHVTRDGGVARAARVGGRDRSFAIIATTSQRSPRTRSCFAASRAVPPRSSDAPSATC